MSSPTLWLMGLWLGWAGVWLTALGRQAHSLPQAVRRPLIHRMVFCGLETAMAGLVLLLVPALSPSWEPEILATVALWLVLLPLTGAMIWRRHRKGPTQIGEAVPVEDPALYRVLQQCGLSSVSLWEVPDWSDRLNARLDGTRQHRRVLLSPGLRRHLTPAALAAVLAHEAGHAQLHHQDLWRGAQILGGGIALVLLVVVAPTSLDSLFWWLAGSRLALLAHPAAAWFRRWCERQADHFAARHTSPAAMLAALEQLHPTPPPDLDPLYRLLFAYHPSVAQRRAWLEQERAA